MEALHQEIDEFVVAVNKQNIQYFSFMRQALQINQLSYWIGNPSVQITNGVLYLDPSPTLTSAQINTIDNYQDYIQLYIQKNKEINQQADNRLQSKIILLMGISNKKNPVETLNRFSEYQEWIEEAKVIKTSHFCYYDSDKANRFYQSQIGQQFNSLQIQRILLRRIINVTIFSTGVRETEVQKLLYLKGLPNQGQKISTQNLFARVSLINQINLKDLAQSPKKMAIKQNTPNTCPICFQQTQGQYAVSILCQHFFHYKCISQWNQNICPMCRYHQQPPVISFCQKCNQCEGLWICLVCGARLCCGSSHDILSQQSHIYSHYIETQHRLSIEAETKFIFDARKPAFLHNMFYSQISQNAYQPESSKSKKGKLSQKITDYQQSISEQMQRQRQYFEQSLNMQRKKHKQILKQKKKKIQDFQNEISEIKQKINAQDDRIDKLENANNELQKQKKIIGELQKMWKNRAEIRKKQIETKQQQTNNQLRNLSLILQEKKQELKDYKRNYELSEKLRKNLKGQKIQAQIFLGTQSKKKKR